MAGIFDEYDAAHKDGGIYEDTKGGGDRQYPDCEATYLLRTKKLSVGVSKNKSKPDRLGQKWAAGEFNVERILSLGRNSENSAVKQGITLSWHVWLPRHSDPELMSTKDAFDLKEVTGFGAAILGVRPEFIDMPSISALFADDGARVAGLPVGMDVTPSTNSESGITYYNVSFFAVDENGERQELTTPDA